MPSTNDDHEPGLIASTHTSGRLAVNLAEHAVNARRLVSSSGIDSASTGSSVRVTESLDGLTNVYR